jgi:hypothetical protein
MIYSKQSLSWNREPASEANPEACLAKERSSLLHQYTPAFFIEEHNGDCEWAAEVLLRH